MGRLGRLTREQLDFVEVFLAARGKIKDVEAALGISYPTVVSRLEQVVAALGAPSTKTAPVANEQPGEPGSRNFVGSASRTTPVANDAEDVLDALARGELTTEQAAARLRPNKTRRER